MPKQPFRFDEVPAKPARAAAAKATTTRVIVKARTPGYVPPGFEVRTRIDDVMFTADASEDAVVAAGDDPDVESVAKARKLDLTD